ncbi:MAG: thiamine-phosphate kinase [Gemmatimonadota bacterium]
MDGEFTLIERILNARGSIPAGVAVDAGDDCAVIEAGEPLALGNDLSVDGVHFRRSWLADPEIGYRAACAALSDLAAMVAQPLGVLLALCLDPDSGADEGAALAKGVTEAAEAVGAGLLGGDISRGGVLTLDVVAVGRCPRPVRRTGARPGDGVWVTGELGAAAAAVAAWKRGDPPEDAARAAFARPAPRIREASWLARAGPPTAMIDLSDGLAGDALRLARASGVAVHLDGPAVPVHPCAGADPSLALRGGEDYELLFTAPADSGASRPAEFEAELGVPLTRVGVVRAGEGVYLRGADGREAPLARGGYDHLEEASA